MCSCDDGKGEGAVINWGGGQSPDPEVNGGAQVVNVERKGLHVSKKTGNAIFSGLGSTFSALGAGGGGGGGKAAPPSGLDLSNPLVIGGAIAAAAGLTYLLTK